MRSNLIGLIGLTLLMLLSACAGGPAYERPEVSLPGQWQSAPAEPSAPAVPSAWWTRFESAELDKLIAAALEGNLDLKAAASRIGQARALARVAGARLLPEVAALGAASQVKEFDEPRRSSTLSLQLGINYELDLWGRNRQTQEAALARLQGSVYARDFVSRALEAEVALAYFQVLSARDRLAVARSTLNNAESLLKVMQVQFRAGAISSLEMERQLGLIASVRASIPPIELEHQTAIDALAVLLGRAPQGFSVSPGSLGAVALPGIAPGLPSDLLERRGDIRQAEANLIAANADINVARAAFLPTIQLTAAGGVASNALSTLLRSGNLVYGLAAGLIAPIFNNGRLQGDLDLAKARQDELVHVYRQTILLALRDVEGALVAARRFAEQAEHQQQLVTHAQAALRLAELRFRNGAVDFTTVLDAERVLLAAQATQQEIIRSRYAAAVNLYRALGGGWG